MSLAWCAQALSYSSHSPHSWGNTFADCTGWRQLCFSPKHLASRHYLSSDLSAFSFGLGVQAFQASAKLPSFGGQIQLCNLTLHWRHRRPSLWQHRSWGCEIVSLEADIQIISFSFWDYRYFLSGWQCQASPPAVNPSGWRSKPIVTQLVSWPYSFIQPEAGFLLSFRIPWICFRLAMAQQPTIWPAGLKPWCNLNLPLPTPAAHTQHHSRKNVLLLRQSTYMA